MITFLETYETRKKEIVDFLQLMKFLENRENTKINNVSLFNQFFYQSDVKIDMTYQALINILKSNVSLMMYNLIEYTVTNLVDSIYDEIRTSNLSYVDVNEYIRAIWRKTILKSTNDPKANYNTFLRKNEEIISDILTKKTLDITARNTLPAGNLDGNTIKDTLEAHGICVQTNSSNYRPDILSSIKDRRNNLAHGSVSFVDAVRMDSISDIESNENFVVNFLGEVIEAVDKYINECGYKSNI